MATRALTDITFHTFDLFRHASLDGGRKQQIQSTTKKGLRRGGSPKKQVT
jgi:hypothetical protein